jgi:hypothetical protein
MADIADIGETTNFRVSKKRAGFKRPASFFFGIRNAFIPMRIDPISLSFFEKWGLIMKLKKFVWFPVLFAVALFSYTVANAQVVEKVKDAAWATKNATVKAAKKTADVTMDAASKTKDVTVDAYDKVTAETPEAAATVKDGAVKSAKVGSSKVNKYGEYTINVTEGVAGGAYEGGKWFMTSTWDGAKWVSKRVWYADSEKPSPAKNPRQ